jgi:hypothetical protein
MSEKYLKIVDFLKTLETDVSKFYEKEQSAAGTRLRKGLSELKKLAQDFRNDIQDTKAKRKEKKSEN